MGPTGKHYRRLYPRLTYNGDVKLYLNLVQGVIALTELIRQDIVSYSLLSGTEGSVEAET